MNSKDKAKKLLLDLPNEELGIGQWTFIPCIDIKLEGDEAATVSGTKLETCGMLVKQLGYVSYVKTFIDDSKQSSSYTFPQEIMDEVISIINECMPLTGDEKFEFQGVNTDDEKGMISFMVEFISDKILSVLANFNQEINIKKLTINSNIVSLYKMILVYGEQYPTKQTLLETFLRDHLEELNTIEDEQQFTNRVTLLMAEFEKKHNVSVS